MQIDKTPGKNTPYLEYEIQPPSKNMSYRSKVIFLRPLNYQKNEGLLFAIAVDDEEPQLINMHEGEMKPDWEYPAWWNNSVTDHIKKKKSVHGKLSAGSHKLKVWMVDPGLVFQKFGIGFRWTQAQLFGAAGKCLC